MALAILAAREKMARDCQPSFDRREKVPEDDAFGAMAFQTSINLRKATRGVAGDQPDLGRVHRLRSRSAGQRRINVGGLQTKYLHQFRTAPS